MIDNYVRLVGIVDSLYYVYENSIIKTDSYKNLDKINLNKKRVDDIFSNYIVDKEFNDYIQFYINSFNNVFITNDLKAVDNILSQIEEGIYFVKQARYRIKSPESIMNKLAKYTDRKENGKIKINKCLNDLFGIRFIIDDYNKLRREFIDYLDIRINQEGKFRNKIKLTSKGYNDISPYIADHVYFSSRLNNNIFPIELQIWDSLNTELNERSHKIYKRGYMDWTNQYNDI